MFDFNRTLALVKGAIFDPDTTWDSYLADAADWQKTALLLTVPLVVASRVLAYVFDFVFPNEVSFIPDTTIMQTVLGIVYGLIGAAIVAGVVAVLAGLFKGRNSFPHALAATTLAFVPGYLGYPLSHIPWIGWLVSLGLGIYGLVLLWRILPKYMEVPDSSRVGHYILSLVGSIVIFMILGAALGINAAGGRGGFDVSDSGGGGSSSGGMFGNLERQGRLMQAAEEDEYDPPGNGMLTRSQVESYVGVLQKTREFRMEQAQTLERLSDKAEDDNAASIAEAMSGMAGIVNVVNAELQVVKTGGGNWAEHNWVKEQLMAAQIQKDINDTVKHNYELYLEFEDELKDLGY